MQKNFIPSSQMNTVGLYHQLVHIFCLFFFSSSSQERSGKKDQAACNVDPEWESLNFVGVETSKPKHASYSTLESRIKSYKAWPQETRRQQPAQLAESGFFYIGTVDLYILFLQKELSDITHVLQHDEGIKIYRDIYGIVAEIFKT